MKRKYIAIIFICVVVIAAAIVIWQAPPHIVLIPHEIDLTSDKTLKEMPYININTDEIALLNSLKSAPDIEVAIRAGTSTDLFDEEARYLVGDMLQECDELSVSVVNGAIYVSYKFNDYRFYLAFLSDGTITKTIGVYRANGEVSTIYENYGNEFYKKYQYRLRFGKLS